MGKLERLAAARERVRKWKATHPKSVEWQRKRWYARKKGERKATVMEAVVRIKKLPKEYPHYGELHRGWVEGVDVGYGEMEPKREGGPGVPERIREPALAETANEARTYAQLEEFKVRRVRMEKRGVEVELIL
jgi:hypothetical protein